MLARRTDPYDPNSHLRWKFWRHEGLAITNKIFKKAAAPATRKPAFFANYVTINLTH